MITTPRTYLAHHELESVVLIIVIIVIMIMIIIIIIVIQLSLQSVHYLVMLSRSLKLSLMISPELPQHTCVLLTQLLQLGRVCSLRPGGSFCSSC